MKKSVFLFLAFILSFSFVKSQSLDCVVDNESSFQVTQLSLMYDNPLRVFGGTFNRDDQLGYGRTEYIEVALPDSEQSKILEFSWKFYGWERYVQGYDVVWPNGAPKSVAIIYLPYNAPSQTTIVATALYDGAPGYVDYVRTFYAVKE